MNPPVASYRLQLREHGIDFAAAGRLIPYLARLGISHLYLSPILKARPGSTHGYDVVDPRVVDPSLGGRRALERLAHRAREHGVALLADVVPNHMASVPEGPCFGDVLARGPASPYAAWFDIDWSRGKGRVILPILGASQRSCIERGEIRLERSRGEIHLRVGGQLLPLSRKTRPSRTKISRPGLERLLRRQHYELRDWRKAGSAINYRRFFDVNDLIALNSDDPAVFAATHGTLAVLLATDTLSGVRVDHVDGLADPEAYLHQLRRIAPRPKLVLVEKILAPGEALPETWPVDGTTGYEYLNAAEAVWIEATGCARLESGWRRRTRRFRSFEQTARAARRQAMRELLQPELERAVDALLESTAAAARLDAPTSREALLAFASHLDAYRVYPRAGGLDGDQRRRVRDALDRAARHGAPRTGLAALDRLLLSKTRAPDRLAAARRIQQLCVSAAAKGVEDTAFYRHAPLLSRLEVGNDPGRPLGDPVAEFHEAMSARARHTPGLSAGSTHDTKRSGDVRARLDVLSEIPDAWLACVDRWREWNAPLRRRSGGPDIATELLFYQTLVGAWPLDAALDAPARNDLAGRLDGYMLKAAREAKRETSWIRPDPRFERALSRFVHGALLPRGGRSPFLRDVADFVGQISRPGLWNALGRRLLQITAPGIPDLYQGDESWSFDLVDPDNRRPVDFAGLRRRLTAVERLRSAGVKSRARALAGFVGSPADGRLVLHVVCRALEARSRRPGLFLSGSYQPVAVEGDGAGHVLAFVRLSQRHAALTVVPRVTRARVPEPAAAPVGAACWGDTRLLLPRELAGRRLICALTGRSRTVGTRLLLGEVLDPLPVALFTADTRSQPLG